MLTQLLISQILVGHGFLQPIKDNLAMMMSMSQILGHQFQLPGHIIMLAVFNLMGVIIAMVVLHHQMEGIFGMVQPIFLGY